VPKNAFLSAQNVLDLYMSYVFLYTQSLAERLENAEFEIRRKTDYREPSDLYASLRHLRKETQSKRSFQMHKKA
jgi:hypothetical protein